MPLKLNVGASRKVADASYCSRGAAVNLEIELDAGLIQDPGKLQERIRQLFNLVRASLSEELNGKSASPPSNPNPNPPTQNGRHAQNGNVRPATQSQVKAIYAIAKHQRLDLARYLNERHGVDNPDKLDVKTASQVIGLLKKGGGTA